MDANEFLQALADHEVSVIDRAVYLLWWHSRENAAESRSSRQLCDEIEAAGYARPNVTILRQSLERDPRTAASNGGFKIKVNKRAAIEDACGPMVGKRRVKPSDSVVPREQFKDRRLTWQELVAEINGCYDHGFFDGAAVLARRLIEALIVEAFKAKGAEAAIKRGDGYMLLEELAGVLSSGQHIKLSKSAKPGLEPIRVLGNTAAHSPHHITKKPDVDNISNHVRVLVSELLNIIDGK